MALIKCPECGEMISEYAEFCVKCGCPRKKIVSKIINHSEINNKENIIVKSGLSNSPFYRFSLTENDKKVVEQFVIAFISNNKKYFIQRHNNYIEICTNRSDLPAFFFEYYGPALRFSYKIMVINEIRTITKYDPTKTEQLVSFADSVVKGRIGKAPSDLPELSNKKPTVVQDPYKALFFKMLSHNNKTYVEQFIYKYIEINPHYEIVDGGDYLDFACNNELAPIFRFLIENGTLKMKYKLDGKRKMFVYTFIGVSNTKRLLRFACSLVRGDSVKRARTLAKGK